MNQPASHPVKTTQIMNPTPTRQSRTGFLKKHLVGVMTGGLLMLGAAPAMAQAGSDATLAAAAKEPGAKVTASGLVMRTIKEGNGKQPTASSTVNVHYKGTFPDGREFDSSYKRGEPIEFPLGGVIKCWTEGVALMKVGGRAKLTCPSSIAYGARGAGGVIPPHATLVFEVELLGVR
jgi:FKBP-type peptidyl-prolyl cis-trans isomerase FkpA